MDGNQCETSLSYRAQPIISQSFNETAKRAGLTHIWGGAYRITATASSAPSSLTQTEPRGSPAAESSHFVFPFIRLWGVGGSTERASPESVPKMLVDKPALSA